jgi:hypothetical protein
MRTSQKVINLLAFLLPLLTLLTPIYNRGFMALRLQRKI